MTLKHITPILSALLLSGCFLDEDSGSEEVVSCSTTETVAPQVPEEKQSCALNYDMAIQTVASDYSSSSVSMACTSEEDIVNGYADNSSDFSLSAGDKLYHLGRDGHHTVSQYNFATPDQANWTCSSNDPGEENSNPYQVLEVSDTKAYIIRYDRTSIWIVNPSAQDAADYKIGEIDLSAYAASTDTTVSSSVEMSSAVLHDEKLYVAMQRLRNGSVGESGYPNYVYTNQSKVAVIDINTDLEVDTTPNDSSNEKAITLEGTNVQTLSLNGDLIYVASRGDYGTEYGTLEVIDTFDYSLTTLVDGDSVSGHIQDVVAIDSNKVYFTVNFSYFDADFEFVSNYGLYKYDGSDAQVVIAGSDSQEFPDIEKDSSGNLWLANGDATNPGVYRYDTTTDASNLFLATELTPRKIVFRQ